ncbi:MAG: VOC family protein [Spirulina sp. SIO3F2]|nr:VOC family protein [Spirulina sp. SIO3F2]
MAKFLELDHVFILVEPGAKVADRLLELGFQEGRGNTHPGQGTANRRFYFVNGMLELLWVRDAEEARQGPGRKLQFPERATNPNASPFGMIFVPNPDQVSQAAPFPGWHYQPDYFLPPQGFHVGTNAENLMEPLCFYFPFYKPPASQSQPQRNPHKISVVSIATPSTDTTGVLGLAAQSDRLSIQFASAHGMEITLDQHRLGRTADFRPEMPLVLHW